VPPRLTADNPPNRAFVHAEFGERAISAPAPGGGQSYGDLCDVCQRHATRRAIADLGDGGI
jgi:hypothetical protein